MCLFVKHLSWNTFYGRRTYVRGGIILRKKLISFQKKVIFIQLQEFPTPPYCRCCSVTKRSDSGIAVALKALKMHF